MDRGDYYCRTFILQSAKNIPYLPIFDKNIIYRLASIKIGKNVSIAPRVQFDYFHPELIEIGNNVLIGDNVEIWSHNYGLNYFGIGHIKIGDNVTIGGSAIIMPCEVGDNVTIGVKSIVYGKIPSNSRVIGQKINEYEKSSKI